MGLLRTLRRGATFAGLGLAGGALVVATRYLLETPQPLESQLPGEGVIDRKHGGDIYYNVAGPVDAAPIVLLHDFYSGASNFEFRHIFARLTEQYRVYAPDWLGFGMSEHPNVAYTGEFYAGVLAGFLRDVVGRPAIVLAHGHAANITVRAASDYPELFDRLVLVSPAVFAGLASNPTITQTVVRTTQRLWLGLVPYAVLATRPALRRLWNSRSVRDNAAPEAAEEDIWHLYASAHQFGGQHAVLALHTGELDLPVQNAFALLEPPVLLMGGARDYRHPRIDLEDLAVLNPHADLAIIPGAGDATFVDEPKAFARAVLNWLSTPASRHVIDESTLLGFPGERASEAPPEQTEPPASAGSMNRIQGQLEAGATAEGALPETPTEGATAPLADAATMPADDEEAGEESGDEGMVGDPGYTVPGVSDMGLEGASTPDMGGITALGGPSVTLGPADAVEAETAHSETAALLPEAGDAEPEDSAERAAREGLDPPLEPETNIGLAGLGEVTDEAVAGSGQVADLAHTMQTPENDVATAEGAVQVPADAIATADEAVQTAGESLDTDEMIAPEPEQEVSGPHAQGAVSTQHTRRAPSDSSGAVAPKAQPHPQRRSGTANSGRGAKAPAKGNASRKRSGRRKDR